MNVIKSNIYNQLENIVGKKYISKTKELLDMYTKDWSFHAPSLADIIVWPKSAKEISMVLKIANKNKIPVIPWGGGSSLEGNPIPTKGGIVLDMIRMNKVLEIMDRDMQVKVQPGIIGDELNDQLKKYNLFFPAAPGSSAIATIGGMIANNAGGMNAVKYGVVGNSVLELEVVLADGRIIRLGSRSVKSVSGYDLKNLIIGSEGTLGVITTAVLKLSPLPKNKIAIMASFETVKDAVNATLDILKSDCEAAAIEFMDKTYIYYVNKAKITSFPEKPTIIIELHGGADVIAIYLDIIKKILKRNKNISYSEFISPSQLKLLWGYRKAVRPVLSKLLPNRGVLSAEVGVPISKVESFLKKAESLSEKHKLQTVMFGHIGDGNFHGWALYELNNNDSWRRVSMLNDELIKFAISVNGTTTGEHGIGIGKRKFLPVEHPTSLPIMKDIKNLFDPNNILNPGKIFID
jgi:D-lactate dehydrogenase (cytochrome)